MVTSSSDIDRDASPSPAVIRVMIVDDHAVVRRGLHAYFAVTDGIEVVAEAPDGRAALELLAKLDTVDVVPDVVMMDLLMPRLDGVETTREIKTRFPHVQVVAMTSFSESERVNAALAAGAAGYLLKDADAGDVARAVRSAHAGEVHLDPVVARILAKSLMTKHDASTTLTDRERDILILVAHGLSNREIAVKLAISERTARSHVSNILTKLGLSSRTQAALWAIREGLVSVT